MAEHIQDYQTVKFGFFALWGSFAGEVSVAFTATTAHHLATVVSMVAPSPDWFVGVSGLDLFVNGNWVDKVVVPLQPYDAGTDSGVTYGSANQDTVPQELIREIIGLPFSVDAPVLPLGTFTFRRIN